MKSLLASLAAVLTFFALATGAHALETGTPAWATADLTMLSGPGAAYDIVGDVASKSRIYVERCAPLWCKIRVDGKRGWVSLQYISFGQHPRGPLTGPRLNYPSGGPGTVCLYSGSNYTGSAICAGSGRVARDLLLYGADNSISSISIEGNVSVTVCRDRFFQSYCERVIESQPHLHGFLDNSVSSYRVY